MYVFLFEKFWGICGRREFFYGLQNRGLSDILIRIERKGKLYIKNRMEVLEIFELYINGTFIKIYCKLGYKGIFSKFLKLIKIYFMIIKY